MEELPPAESGQPQLWYSCNHRGYHMITPNQLQKATPDPLSMRSYTYMQQAQSVTR